MWSVHVFFSFSRYVFFILEIPHSRFYSLFHFFRPRSKLLRPSAPRIWLTKSSVPSPTHEAAFLIVFQTSRRFFVAWRRTRFCSSIPSVQFSSCSDTLDTGCSCPSTWRLSSGSQPPHPVWLQVNIQPTVCRLLHRLQLVDYYTHTTTCRLLHTDYNL